MARVRPTLAKRHKSCTLAMCVRSNWTCVRIMDTKHKNEVRRPAKMVVASNGFPAECQVVVIIILLNNTINRKKYQSRMLARYLSHNSGNDSAARHAHEAPRPQTTCTYHSFRNGLEGGRLCAHGATAQHLLRMWDVEETHL